MPAWNNATINNVLDAVLNGAAFTTSTTPVHIRLTTTAPTATTNGTELTGTGYTAGGTTIAWGTPASGSVSGSGAAIQWTNSSGSTWSIVGLEIWDTNATPVRKFFGTFTGQPISVANGNIFQVTPSNVTISANG